MTPQENNYKKYLYNEVTFVISVIAAAFWVINWINSPVNDIRLDIELMKKDIKTITESHIKYGENADKRDEAIVKMQIDIAKIVEILNKE